MYINEIILAIVAMVAFGLVGIVYKVATDYMDSISMVFFVYLFSTILTGIVWLLSPNKFITCEGLKLVVIASVLAAIGMMSYIYALKIGFASVVVPIRNLALVVTVSLAILILKEEVTFTKTAGITLAVIALILLSR